MTLPNKLAFQEIVSPDEAWVAMLSKAEGDVATAVSILIDDLQQPSTSENAALAITAMVDHLGIAALLDCGIWPYITTALESASAHPHHRRAALLVVTHLLEKCGKPVEPLLIDFLSSILGALADTDPSTASLGSAAGQAFVERLNPHATRLVIAALLAEVERAGKQWQSRAGVLNLLTVRAKRCPVECGQCLPDILPVLSDGALDARPEVAAAAHEALLACCYTGGNRDLEPCVPAIAGCIEKPDRVPEVVERLACTTFVQSMGPASLALLAPLMQRALQGRGATKMQLQACVTIRNFSKMVERPADAWPFVLKLIPALGRLADEAAKPELREGARQALDALEQIRSEAGAEEFSAAKEKISTQPKVLEERLLRALRWAFGNAAPTVSLSNPLATAALGYVSVLCASLVSAKRYGPRSWELCCAPYLTPVLDEDPKAARALASWLRNWALKHLAGPVDASSANGAPGQEELCDCEFNLAYGGRILLMGATLRLFRGRRYGLCGPNGVGKSTLMRAIAKGYLEGFPPKEELRTVYVEHDIDASESQATSVDWIFGDTTVQEAVAPSRSDVAQALAAVGFSSELQASPIASLSGGWRMKLALARAMLLKADILLLDEPTNHLDTYNVQWLQNYLVSNPKVSSIIVSHDAAFLDAVVTDIISFEPGKLVHYPGSLSEFAKARPEARSYYELKTAGFKFRFPDPGFLDGIKGKSQSVMRATGVGFSYPGATTRVLSGVSVRCTLGSRVAVLGGNGAGKSTLVKLLTGELEPSEGSVWRHPNLRVAYVAQHAFHHIEEHLDITPAEYLWWRFGDGEDREAREKVTRKVTEAEQKEREAAIARGSRVVDYLNSRHMNSKAKEYEYEVAWVGQSQRENTWMLRSELCSEKMGLSKLVEEMDARISMYRMYRQLTTPLVLSHLKEFGLEESVATATKIRGLSGGQKVKLVLGAAMWVHPHVLVLDEPTNYLDRESLGALAAGITEFNGGVLMISHSPEFTTALCKEEWKIADGRVQVVTASSADGGGEDGNGAADVEGGVSAEVEEETEAELAAKAAKKADKERIAAEKAAKKAEKAKLRFAKKF